MRFPLAYTHVVIKLFGIYTHAQLDREKQSWKNVSKQLSGKGSEYRKRCVVMYGLQSSPDLSLSSILYRMNTAARGDKVYAPATFPLNTEQEDPSPADDLRHLGAEEQQDVGSFAVLLMLNNLLISLGTVTRASCVCVCPHLYVTLLIFHRLEKFSAFSQVCL